MGPARPLVGLLLSAWALFETSAQRPPRPSSEDTVNITIPDGCVKGSFVIVVADENDDGTEPTGAGDYVAFRGIPYAEPPKGTRRFRGPRTGPQALPRGSDKCLLQQPERKCVQFTRRSPQSSLEGDEDCLQLNVYVPLDRKVYFIDRIVPVLFYIHGGNFMYGSASEEEAGPEFFMEHNNAILVTINYRLGAFGFLNLGIDEAPGNAGLKDQLAALQWVRRNIASLGGDPGDITIFGSGAGAASVHFHTLVPASRGLFRAAIMQSGNALAGFAYHEFHSKYARLLYNRMRRENAENQPSTSEMLKYFQEADAVDVLSKTAEVIEIDTFLQQGYPPFCPSPERRTNALTDKFLEADPEYLVLTQRDDQLVPTILGLSGEEGLFLYYYSLLHKLPALVKYLKENPGNLITATVAPFSDAAHALHASAPEGRLEARRAEYSAWLRRAYSLQEPGEENFISLLSGIFTGIATERLLNMTIAAFNRQQVPLYRYHFLHDGDYNWGKISLNISSKQVTFTDELGYLMRITSPRDLGQTYSDLRPSQSTGTLFLLTKLWTDFANKVDLEETYGWPKARGMAGNVKYAKLLFGKVQPSRQTSDKRMEALSNIFDDLRL